MKLFQGFDRRKIVPGNDPRTRGVEESPDKARPPSELSLLALIDDGLEGVLMIYYSDLPLRYHRLHHRM